MNYGEEKGNHFLEIRGAVDCVGILKQALSDNAKNIVHSASTEITKPGLRQIIYTIMIIIIFL